MSTSTSGGPLDSGDVRIAATGGKPRIFLESERDLFVEARGVGMDRAVAEGVTATAGTVTSAAAVMVAVFAIFATLGSIEFKMMGVGLATAILIDATVVRAVLLPASMKLLGEWNRYLPRWLEWLPQAGGGATGPARARSSRGTAARRRARARRTRVSP